MTRSEDILKDHEIADFRETHAGAKEEIDRAAEELAVVGDAVEALKKMLPALAEKTLPIFFSYKTKDEDTAIKIVKALRAASGQLNIIYQADFTEKVVGKKWREWILESIKKASWFILLLPDPREDWDWCLFETGVFEAHRTSADRLICLHHPDSRPPHQIEGYEAVSATIPNVEDFLKVLFVNKSPIPGFKPINPDADIQAIAKRIVEAMRPPQKPCFHKVFEPCLQLECQDVAKMEEMDEFDRAILVEANKAALDLFDFDVVPRTWGELRSGLPEGLSDNRWREQLFHVVRRIARGRKFRPIFAVFQTHANRTYRPIAWGIDRIGDQQGPVKTFQICFAESISAVDHSKMPESLAALTTVLRFAFRFRWEVLEKFTAGRMTEADVARLDSAIERMADEWASRGIGDQSAIESLFQDDEEKGLVGQMFREWALLKNPQGTGELDIAIENNDTQKIQEILKRIVPMNQEFLELATNTFSQLVHKGSLDPTKNI